MWIGTWNKTKQFYLGSKFPSWALWSAEHVNKLLSSFRIVHLVLSSLSRQFCELVAREDVSPQWSIFIVHKVNAWCELHCYKQKNYNPSVTLRPEVGAVQLFKAEGKVVSQFHRFRSFSAGWVIQWGILPTKELQSIFFALTFSGPAQLCSFSPSLEELERNSSASLWSRLNKWVAGAMVENEGAGGTL